MYRRILSAWYSEFVKALCPVRGDSVDSAVGCVLLVARVRSSLRARCLAARDLAEGCSLARGLSIRMGCPGQVGWSRREGLPRLGVSSAQQQA